MQSTIEGTFGYSDFFASGIDAITRTRSVLESKSPTPSTSSSPSRLRRLSFSHKRTACSDPNRSSRKRESFIQFSSNLADRLSASNGTILRYISRYVVPRQPDEIPSFESTDPFASSPEAKSIFIHPFEMSPLSMIERESFLAFTDSSAVSLVPIPCRPMSMGNVSWEQHCEKDAEDTWTLDLDHLEEDQEVDEHYVDWRRFHVDVLDECIAN